MNRHCHRLIYNRRRQQLMAVSDHAIGRHKAKGETAAAPTPERASLPLSRPLFVTPHSWQALTKHPLLASFSLLSLLLAAAPAQAQIIADPNAPVAQRPTVLTTGNGVALINIQTPNGNGISHNTYRQFDIPASGAILNNAPGRSVTQLSGAVPGNPWMSPGGARLILNEVNSSAPSQLGGLLEVAGTRAQVIVANPAGITCTGCGFINAGELTLAAGAPFWRGDTLAGYRVSEGRIEIAGAGMNAGQSDYTTLIARAASLNAGLWAKRLNVLTGSGDFPVGAEASVQSAPASAAGTASANPPAFALDVAQLGGMYADQIHLVGTEHGLGVRNAGTLAAIGQIKLSADGTLTNSGRLTAGGDLTVKAHALDNPGRIETAHTLTLAAADTIENRGALIGQRLNIAATALDNHQGSIRQSGGQRLDITAGHLANRSGGRIGTPDQATDAPPPADAPAAAAPPADGRIDVQSALTNDGGRIAANGRTALTTRGSLDNAGGTLALDTLHAWGERLDNASGKISADTLALSVGTLNNRGGELLQTGDRPFSLALAGKLDNTDGKIAGGNDLNVQANVLNNTRGQLLSGGQAAFIAGELNNTQGALSGTHGLSVTASGRLANRSGRIASNGDLSIEAGSLDNADGQLLAGANFRARIARALETTGNALIAAGADLSLEAGSLNNAARLQSGRQLTLSAGNLNNAGAIHARGDAHLHAAQLTQSATGAITAQGQLALNAGEISSRGALGAQTLNVDASGRATLSGTHAADSLAFNAGSLDLAGSRNQAANILLTAGQGDIDASGARLTASNRFAARTTKALRLDGARLAADSLTLSAQALSNRGGELIQAGQGDFSLALSGALDNTGGKLLSAGNMTLTAERLHNHDGTLHANQNLTLTTQRTDNAGGRLRAAQGDLTHTQHTGSDEAAGIQEAGGKLSLKSGGALTFAATDRLSAGQSMSLTAGGDLTTAGQWVTNGDINVQAAGLNLRAGSRIDAKHIALNAERALTGSGTTLVGEHLALRGANLALTGSTLSSAGAARLESGGALTFSGSRLTAGTDATFSAPGGMDTRGASVLAGGQLTARAATLDNTGGSLAGKTGLTLNTATVDNTNGKLLTEGSAQVSAQNGFKNTGGTLAANGDLTLDTNAGVLDNTGGTLAAGGKLTAKAQSVPNEGGTLSADKELQFDTQHYSGAGTLASGKDLIFNLAGDYTLEKGNILHADGSLTATLGGHLLNYGTFEAVKDIIFTAGAITNEAQGTMRAGNRISLNAGTLVNRGTLAAPKVDLAADNLLNTGLIVGSNTVTLSAQNLENRGPGAIAALKTLKIYASNALHNLDGGWLYSGGDLTLAGGPEQGADGRLKPINSFLNRSALIQAGDRSGGLLELSVNHGENARTHFRPYEVASAPSIELIQQLDGNRAEWPAQLIGRVYPNGYIEQTHSIKTCTSENPGPFDRCHTHTEIHKYELPVYRNADEYERFLQTMKAGSQLRTLPTEKICGSWDEGCKYKTTTITATRPVYHGTEHWPIPEAASVPTFTILNMDPDENKVVGRRYAIVKQTFERQAEASAEGQILSGGDIRISAGTFENTYSRIEARGAIDQSRIGRLTNSAYELGKVERKTTYVGICSHILGDTPGRLGRCGGAWQWPTRVEETRLGEARTLGGVIASNQGLDLTAATIENQTVGHLTINNGQGNGQNGTMTSGSSPGINLTANGESARSAEAIARQNPQATGLSPFAPPAGAPQAIPTLSAPSLIAAREALFRIPESRLYLTQPDNPNVLVSATPLLGGANFQDSAPYLDEFGLNTLKRLGDGFYEQQLVAEQLRLLSDRVHADDYADANARYRALLEAGKDAAKRFNFTPGISLSAEQVAQLSEHIVWMETRVINGQNVLVPVVYAAGGASAVKSTGARLSGGKYTRIVAGHIDNRGLIEGDLVQAVATQTFANAGGVVRGKLVDLASGGDMTLTASR